jgi:hypothetical protein
VTPEVPHPETKDNKVINNPLAVRQYSTSWTEIYHMTFLTTSIIFNIFGENATSASLTMITTDCAHGTFIINMFGNGNGHGLLNWKEMAPHGIKKFFLHGEISSTTKRCSTSLWYILMSEYPMAHELYLMQIFFSFKEAMNGAEESPLCIPRMRLSTKCTHGQYPTQGISVELNYSLELKLTSTSRPTGWRYTMIGLPFRPQLRRHIGCSMDIPLLL